MHGIALLAPAPGDPEASVEDLTSLVVSRVVERASAS